MTTTCPTCSIPSATEIERKESRIAELERERDEARRIVEEQARRITIFVMDQRRQLPADVLTDIADSHTARDRAIADRDQWKARAEAAERERDEANRLLEAAHVRNYQDADEASALAVDEDGCCATCGRDALWFENGRLVNRDFADNLEADARRTAERDTAEQIAAFCDRMGWDHTADMIRDGE